MVSYKFFKPFIKKIGNLYFGINVGLKVLIVSFSLANSGFEVDELLF